MKKIYTIILMLCLTAVANAADYNLKIAGITITEKNRYDVFGNGTVSFTPSANPSSAGYIMLHNANIKATGNDYAIEYTGTLPLTIFNSGTSKITGPTRLIHVPNANLEFIGDNYLDYDHLTDKLILTGTNTGFGNVYCGGEMLIRCLHIESKGGYSGLGGRSSSELCQKITVEGSKLDLSGDNAAIAYVKAVQLERTDVATTDASFDANKRTYVVGSTPVKALAMSPTEYPIYVCGVQFNGYNCTYRGIKGVKYVPQGNTVLFDNVTVTSYEKDVPVLNYKSSKLVNVGFNGNNTLKTTNSILTINSWGPMNIYSTTGNESKLTLECESDHSNDYSVITVQNSSLVVNKVDIVGNTDFPLIGGLNSYNPNVGLSNCNITHNTTDRLANTINHVGDITTNNSSIYSKGYGIKFSKSGNHTIKVTGASYFSSDAACIHSHSEDIDITISGQGENSSKLVLTGLNLSGYNNIGIMSDGNVNIKDVEFNISNVYYGIGHSNSGKGKTVTLDAMRGTIEGKNSTIYAMSAVNLINGTTIVEPVGAVFKDGYYRYGGNIIKKIKFNISADGIEGIEADNDAQLNNQKTYNLQGIEVGNGYRGIVVKNGKKHIAK